MGSGPVLCWEKHIFDSTTSTIWNWFLIKVANGNNFLKKKQTLQNYMERKGKQEK